MLRCLNCGFREKYPELVFERQGKSSMINNDRLRENIERFVTGNRDNHLEKGVRFFDLPLIGFCRADDSLFMEFKNNEAIIGSCFRTPEEWLSGAVSVISYFLPISKEIRMSNYTADKFSAMWLHCRFKGEQFNLKLQQFIVDMIEANGGQALAPALNNGLMVDYNLFRSNWSERHIAYIAGLGTFGLNRGLITSKGMAGRFGSVITDLRFIPTDRQYSDPFEYCPGVKSNSCLSCIKRCPAGAISSAGMNKTICHHLLRKTDSLREVREAYNYSRIACGKCQTNVPCENEIPTKNTIESQNPKPHIP